MSADQEGVPDGAETFRRVWLQTTLPRSSMTAYRDRKVGALNVHRLMDCAEFRTKAGEVIRLDRVTGLTTGLRGTDFVNQWIEVQCDVESAETVVYIKDARWLGWRALLTGSNRRIVRSLSLLLPSAQEGDSA